MLYVQVAKQATGLDRYGTFHVSHMALSHPALSSDVTFGEIGLMVEPNWCNWSTELGKYPVTRFSSLRNPL